MRKAEPFEGGSLSDGRDVNETYEMMQMNLFQSSHARKGRQASNIWQVLQVEDFQIRHLCHIVEVSQFSYLPDFKMRHIGQFRQHVEICSAPKFDIKQPQILKRSQKRQRRYGNGSKHQFLQPAE